MRRLEGEFRIEVKVYRVGPNRVAIIYIRGTNYACNKYACNMLAILCFQRELNMPAISNPKRTIYPCNFFPREPNMLAITGIVLEAVDYDF